MARTVVVTGGGTGIGKAIAERFLGDGETVVIVGRRLGVLQVAREELARSGLGKVLVQQCDVSEPDQVEGLAGWLEQEVAATVDVLVNNAGGTGSIEDGVSVHEAAAYARDMLSANLIGAYLMVHALARRMRSPGGRIVNISSIAAFRGGGDMYSAAKAGLVGLSYSLAQDFGPLGITVNVVAPGLVLGTEFFGDQMTVERKQRTVAQVPAGRAGRPEDIAESVHYLASDGASYVTGEVLHVNGGWLFGR